ncbi:hypothetical protein BH10PSE2_BH10PSE2_24210 [soil metagenome]
MVAFFVIFGFLAFGAAVVAWATRHTWSFPGSLPGSLPVSLTPARLASLARQPVKRPETPPTHALPTPSADPFAGAAQVVETSVPASAPAFPARPTDDPFAHAPSMSPPVLAEIFHSETRH